MPDLTSRVEAIERALIAQLDLEHCHRERRCEALKEVTCAFIAIRAAAEARSAATEPAPPVEPEMPERLSPDVELTDHRVAAFCHLRLNGRREICINGRAVLPENIDALAAWLPKAIAWRDWGKG